MSDERGFAPARDSMSSEGCPATGTMVENSKATSGRGKSSATPDERSAVEGRLKSKT
jgi:hypothetical protein